MESPAFKTIKSKSKIKEFIKQDLFDYYQMQNCLWQNLPRGTKFRSNNFVQQFRKSTKNPFGTDIQGRMFFTKEEIEQLCKYHDWPIQWFTESDSRFRNTTPVFEYLTSKLLLV